MVTAAKPKTRRGRGYHYLLIGTGWLLAALLIFAIVFFWDEMRDFESWGGRYGYAGGFLAGILGGITIIPIPSLLVVFALGGVLNPIYVGLISGLGEALGGITVYLTGVGGGALWSKLWSGTLVPNHQRKPGYDSVSLAESKFKSRGQAVYNRIANSMGRRGSSWLIFVVSAMIISPSYFAGLAAGTLHMGLRRFFLISWAGKTVRGLMIALAGNWGLHFLRLWLGG